MRTHLFNEGEERWISWQMYLGGNFPINANTWQSVAQFKQLGSMGTPIVNMDAAKGQWRMNYANSNRVSNGGFTPWAGPALKEKWVKFSLRIKFSPNPAVGFIELYGDTADGKGMRQLLGKTMTWTMKKDEAGRAIQSHVRLGSYRNPIIQGTADIYYDGFTVATTRAAAEASAF
jgi:hypothetical protein